MHIPPAFSVTDAARLTEFLHRHSFAILVSVDGSENQAPIATHLPLVLECDDEKPARLAGHFARGNPQWRIADQRKVLAVFSGPHAYISAGWYGEAKVVPTWNYVAVHVTGQLRIEHSRERLMVRMAEAVQKYEQHSLTPWEMTEANSDYHQNLLEGIVGFEIQIESIEGSWKLNQHHSEARRIAVISGLQSRGTGDDLEIAALMESTLDQDQLKTRTDLS